MGLRGERERIADRRETPCFPGEPAQNHRTMGWVYDGSAGRLEYYDRRGARVHEFSVAAIAGAPGVLDLLFSAADSSKLTDEDVGRLVRLLAARRRAEKKLGA